MITILNHGGMITTLVTGAGPPGPSGADAPAVTHVDYSDDRYAYVGYATHIVRIDYDVSPPLPQVANSGDWDNRTTLEYN